MIPEKLFFKNGRGFKLCGLLSNPTSQKDKPIIVLCHGFLRSKDGRTYLRLEKILNHNGISTFRFDFFGHGESDGKFEEITTSEAVDDVQKAIIFLKELGYKKIGLFGSSFGGLASLIAASKTERLYLLALKSPVSDYLSLMQAGDNELEIKKWKENGFTYMTAVDGKKLRLKYSFFKDAQRVNGYEAASKIKIPTLIVHGGKDVTIPAEQSKKTATLIKNCRLEIIEGADHTYSKDKDFERMLDLISKFIVNNS